ncbi:hypothetical protein [Microcoleus sp. F4-D5]|uniref:hypothetical protein n=1 Tax=Microcoleus sp. F4-D5 TaxID=2818760 RepID=UPI002FD17DD7
MGKFHAGCNDATITNSKKCSIAIKTNTRKLEGEFMSNIQIAGFQSNLIEELDDADLMAVVGGGIVGDLASNLTGAISDSGNQGTPTSATIQFAGNTVSGAGQLVSGNVGTFGEVLLQGVNGTATDLGNSL